MSDRLDNLSPEEQRRLLAELLAKKRAAEPRERPLAPAQQRLWFIDQLVPGNPVYNIPFALHLEGVLDAEVLRRALEVVAERHETLRTTIVKQGSEPVQVVAPPGRWELPVVSLADAPAGTRFDRAVEAANEEARRPFDLSAGPLVRTMLYEIGPEENLFVLVFHHIVAEAWSVALLFEEIEEVYGALREERKPQLPRLAMQYGEYAKEQRDLLDGHALEPGLAYWREQLAGPLPTLELPADRSRPAVQSLAGRWIETPLDPDLTRRLKKLAREEGSTLYMVLLAAFQTLLMRYSGEEDVVIGSPVAGRNRPETERMFGFFVNTIVLRSGLQGDPSFRELIGRVKEVSIGAFGHQDVPFEKLVEELSPERSLSHAPLVQTIFALQNNPAPVLSLSGLKRSRTLGQARVHNGGAKVDLTLVMMEREGTLHAAFEYSTDLFEEATIRRFLAQWRRLLEEIVADPGRSLWSLDILPADERSEIVDLWNRTATPYPRDRSVHELFSQVAEERPDAVAIASQKGVTTYAELEKASNRLAHLLLERGATPGALIGICLDRSPDLVVGLLAILKAGAAYLPLDPKYPSDRLAMMLEDASVALAVTDSELAYALPAGVERIEIDGERASLAKMPEKAPRTEAAGGSLCYAIYTSGSTGRPKGALVPHRAVSRLVLGTNYVELGPDETILQFAPISFDASTFEIWGALLNGARLEVFPPGIPSLGELGRFVAEKGISTMWLTGALFHQMVDGQLESLRGVRQMLAGGDVLSVPHVRRVLEELPGTRVINGYGPTENTTFTCCYPMDSPADVGATVSIGRPIANTRVYIVDRKMNPVPIGVPGELHAGGDGLADGYLDRPELTAERFVPDPFSEGQAGRLYNTGDYARWLPDGRIEFLGRRDHQVKVRGFRIELGEIESALGDRSEVKQTVAIVREDRPGDKRIVAYVVPEGDVTPSVSDLREHVKEILPDYMVPSAIVVLDALPVTANGKVDRAALPAPEGRGSAEEKRFVAPRDNVELQLAHMWEELLGTSPVGATDDFFELGGHSLIAVQMFDGIKERFGKELPLDVLFQSPTVERLAAMINSDEAEEPASTLITIQPLGERPPLFLVPPASSPGLVYAAVARHLGKEQPIYGLTPEPLDGRQPPENWFEATATEYVEKVRSVQASGPYRIGGGCFGGILAYEISQQLRAAGEEVDALFMMDPGFPLLHDSSYWIRRTIAGAFASTVNMLKQGEPWQYVVIPRHKVRWDVLTEEERAEASYTQQVWNANLRAAAHYVTRPYAGRLTLILSRQLHAHRAIARAWDKMASSGAALHMVECKHEDQLHEPHAQVVARHIRETLDRLDGGSSSREVPDAGGEPVVA